jgi:hypothetical protein
VSSDAYDIDNPVDDSPTRTSSPLESNRHALTDDTLPHAPHDGGASDIVPQALVLAGLDGWAISGPAGQHGTARSWGLGRFVAQNERIDSIRLGRSGRAPQRAHTQILLAQLDDILSILYPA